MPKDPKDDNDLPETVNLTDRTPAEKTVPTVDKAGAADRLHPSVSIPKQFGEYTIGREIGRGGMGIVYEATEADLNRRVAIKILPVNSQMAGVQKKRFQNESRAVAQLNHRCIIPVYSVGEIEGVSYYAMRFIQGQDLHNVIRTIRTALSTDSIQKSDTKPTGNRSTKRRGGSESQPPSGKESTFAESVEITVEHFERIPSGRRYRSTMSAARAVAKMGAQIADALEHAHQMGVVHRDIKPSNLMLDNEGHPWITDFGLAQIKDAPSLTRTGVVLGTLRYMSPEQLAGIRGLVDHRTDIYSLGATLYELLTLQHLVTGDSSHEIIREVMHGPPVKIRKIDNSVPEDLAIIIEKAMSKSPLDRYPRAADLADDLRRYLTNQSIIARRPGAVKRCKQWATRHKNAAAAIVVGFIGIFFTSLVATGAVWNAWNREFVQRQQTEEALSESEGLRLLANAALELPRNPGLSLALATLGSKSAPGIEAKRILLQAGDANHEYATVYPRKGAACGHVSISPNGEYCITSAAKHLFGKGNQPATVHRMTDGEVVMTLDAGNCITSGIYSPNGQHILTTSSAPTYRVDDEGPLGNSPVLWNGRTGEQIHEFAGCKLPETHPRIFNSQDGSLLLLKGADVVVFDTATQETKLSLQGDGVGMFYAEFSPDGSSILAVDSASQFYVWDREGQPIGKPRKFLGSTPGANVHFTADSQGVVVSDVLTVHRVELDALRTGSEEQTASTSGRRIFMQGGSTTFAACDQQNVFVMSDADLGEVVRIVRPVDRSSVRITMHADWLAVAEGLSVKLYSSQNGEELGELLGHTKTISALAVSLASTSAATVSSDGSLRLWRLHSGTNRRRIPTSSTESKLLDVSSKGDLLACTGGTRFQTRVFQVDGDRDFDFIKGAISRGFRDINHVVIRNRNEVRLVDPLTSRTQFRADVGKIVNWDSAMVGEDDLFVVALDGSGVLINVNTGSRWPLATSERIVGGHRLADTSTLIIATVSGRYFGFDVDTKRETWSRMHPRRIEGIFISKDAKRLAIMDDEEVHIVSADGNADADVVHPYESEVSHAVLSATHILAHDATSCKSVYARSLDDPNKTMRRDLEGRVVVSVQPKSSLAVVGSGEGAFLWDLESDAETPITDQPVSLASVSETHVAVVVKNPDGTDASLEIYAIEGMQLSVKVPLSLAPFAMKFDSAGNYVVLSERGYAVNIHDAHDTVSVGQLPLTAATSIWGSYNAKDELNLLTSDGTFYRMSSRDEIAGTVRPSDSKIKVWQADADSEFLLMGTATGELILQSLEGELNPKTLLELDSAIVSVSLSDGATAAALVDEKGLAQTFDLRTQATKRLEVPDSVRCYLSGSGKKLIVLDKGGSAWLCDVATGAVQMLKSEQSIRSARFSFDESLLGLRTRTQDLEIRDGESGLQIGESIPRVKDFRFPKLGEMRTFHSTTVRLWDLPGLIEREQWPIDSASGWVPSPADGETYYSGFPVLRWSKSLMEGKSRALSDSERERFKIDLIRPKS